MKKIFLTLLIVAVAGIGIYSIATKTAKPKAAAPVTNNTAILNDKTTTQVTTPSPVENTENTKKSTDTKTTTATKKLKSTDSPVVKETSSTSSTNTNNTTNTNTDTSKNTASQSDKSSKTQQNTNSKDSVASPNAVNTKSSNTTESTNTKSNDANSNTANSNSANSSTNTNSNTSTNSDTPSSNSSSNKATTNQASTTSSKNNQNNDNENNLNATTINSSTFNSSVFNQIKALANPGTAFIANLNSYKIVNGVKYYNVYQYSIDKSSKGWVYDGNYSNFIGARYMSTTGALLNNQYTQNFDSLSTSQKESTLYNLAKEFVSYFPDYNASISVDMNNTKDVDGYHCYLINWGKRSFYMNLAGYIFVNKSQSFY